MMPVPKGLLIHTVQMQEILRKDAWGKGTLSDPVTVQHVRLDPSAKYVRTKEGEEIQLAAVLFYDCKNSRPKGLVFTDNQILSFNGEKYRVQLAEPLYDGRRLHHYELGLIRHA